MIANIPSISCRASLVRPTLFLGWLCGVGLSLNVLGGVPAKALTVTNSATFSPVLDVDGGVLDTGLTIGGLGTSVTSVSVAISLTKCGGLASITTGGVCTSSDFSFNREIQLFLASPLGTMAGLVYQDDLSGQTPGATVTWNFQDSFSGVVGGASLVSGNYQPSDTFSVFNGEDPNGIWSLYYEDTTPGGPFSINSWSISVTDNTPPGPGPSPADVPGPLPLLGVAATFAWSRRIRTRLRVGRDLRSRP